MRVILQRVSTAAVSVDNQLINSIQSGFVILAGFTHEDEKNDIDAMIQKLIHLRIFEDKEGKLNQSLVDVQGEVLSISQFTLYADTTNGRRPSFTQAASQDKAKALYHYFNQEMQKNNIIVKPGIFGAYMDVSLINSGPVTIMLDSKDLKHKVKPNK